MLQLFFITDVVPRVLCVYLKFRHHPHPLGYLFAKFRFFRGLRCCASKWRKIAYPITQSLTQLIWCPGNRSLCFGKTSQLLWVL